MITDLNLLDEKENWKNLKSITLVESCRQTNNTTSAETRYYIGSIDKTAKEFNKLIRWHWQIDITFAEDNSRKREGSSAENFSLLTKTAINIIKTNTTDKLSMANKQLKALLNEDCLMNIIKSSCV